MHEKFFVTPTLSDLYISYFGHEVCEKNHVYGPAVRDHYLYVFVVNGKGVYKSGGREFSLTAGQAFILFPNVLTFYQADSDQPWEYMWFGFNGKRIKEYLNRSDIHIEQPILTHIRPGRILQLFHDLYQYQSTDVTLDELFYTGILSIMLAEICRDRSKKSIPSNLTREASYVMKAKNFMNLHYDKDIIIEDVARYISLERSYFSKMFKAATGVSPYQYILDLRISKGEELLLNTDLPISHIGLLLGFKDTFHFSNFFKRKLGLSPLNYRKSFSNYCFDSPTNIDDPGK